MVDTPTSARTHLPGLLFSSFHIMYGLFSGCLSFISSRINSAWICFFLYLFIILYFFYSSFLSLFILPSFPLSLNILYISILMYSMLFRYFYLLSSICFVICQKSNQLESDWNSLSVTVSNREMQQSNLYAAFVAVRLKNNFNIELHKKTLRKTKFLV